jgi:peptidyl-prolyl cis-trans isomerase C
MSTVFSRARRVQPHHVRQSLVAAAVTTAVVAVLWFSGQPLALASDPVVAKVNGTAITRADLEALQSQLPPFAQQQPLSALYPRLVDRLVDGKLVLAKAKSEKFEQDPEVRKQIALLQDRVIEQIWVHRQIDKQLTDEVLKKAYDESIKSFKAEDQVRARHILVPTKEEADKLLARLKKGEDFAALAKEASKDGSASSGGDLGFFGKGQMVKPFEEAAFGLKVGEVSKAPVQSQFGWHLIKVEERKPSTPPSFEESKAELKESRSRELADKIVADLRKDAKIERFDLDGKPLTDAKTDAKPAESSKAEPAAKPAEQPKK